jgi:hypothetical protein
MKTLDLIHLGQVSAFGAGVCLLMALYLQCTPSGTAQALADIHALQLGTTADCQLLTAIADPVVDVVCVAVEGSETAIATALRANAVTVLDIVADGGQHQHAAIFTHVDSARAQALVASMHDGGKR